ncbi:hypothetical protein E2562_026807 [Oryza meyeriana var. granulata]|uniref:Uncharacterized protein n=1 Tax=Oryza meyeriana var. granulata TaxID=110450 RepID=A0A6G1CJ23_9ORYZ|nr:hypothetical protein E2562_026807 [Oryza meyeriana var. granulata]
MGAHGAPVTQESGDGGARGVKSSGTVAAWGLGILAVAAKARGRVGRRGSGRRGRSRVGQRVAQDLGAEEEDIG